MKISLDKGAYMPTRAHTTDAGLDIRSRQKKILKPYNSAVFNTGVHIQLPKNTAGVLISKSGMNVNHNITSTGLIDEGYTGEICVKLYNHGNRPYVVEKGDKISQLVIIPVFYEAIQVVASLDENTERGSDGFGSTGR